MKTKSSLFVLSGSKKTFGSNVSTAILIGIFLALSSAPCALSQIPQGFNYQAIARDGVTGNPITDPVDIKIAILSDDDPVTIIREELHSAVDPDEHGLFSLVVGQGSYVSGLTNFSDIDWTVTPKYILTKIFYGGDWQELGPAQLWSVPYAMYSPSTNPWLLNGSSLYYTMGYVGIETDIPVAPLTVRYNDNTGITYPLYLQNQSGDWTAAEKGVGLKFGRVNPTSGHDYGTIRGTIASNNGGAGRLQFTGGGGTDPHVTIDHIGNVGIGTTSPEYQLHTTANVRLNSSVVGDGIELNFHAAGNRYSGIDFHGDDTYTDYALRIIRNNTGPDAESRIEHRGTGELSLQTDEAAPITFRTSYAERLRIAANGNIGIGTTNPGGYKLFINGGNVLVSDGTGLSGTLKLTGHSYIGSSDWGNLSLFAGSNSGNATLALITENVGRVYIKGNGNVGIGTDAPSGRLDVAVPVSEAWADETPLFEVKNNHGIPVLAVYNNGVKILVEHEPAGKGVKGGFTIGGYDFTKAGRTVDFMRITPDTIRFNINNDNTKGPKGGFAIGGYDITGKGNVNQDFMYVTPQTSSSGLYNTFLGYKSGNSNGSTAHSNSFIGNQAGFTNFSGYSNVFIGYKAGYTNYSGVSNVYVGTNAGEKNLGSNNVLVGDDAGKSLTGGNKNLYIGSLAGSTDINGDYNTYIGIEAGRYETGSDNVLIGYGAGYGAGESNLFAIGNRNNNGLISGYFNTKKIYLWGDVKIESTNSAPRLHIKGEGNVMNIEGSTYCYTYYYPDGFAAGAKAFVGYGNGTTNDFTIENYVSSGNIQINPGSSATVQIANLQSAVGTALVVDANGKIYKSVSDARLKENIRSLQGTLGKILQLNGVSFSMKNDQDHKTEIGLIAQEVEKVYPELVMISNDGYESVKYQNITAILIEGMKEQQKQIESQQQQIDRLEALVEKLMEK